MAPEVDKVTNETGYDAYKADVYSFGCTIYYLCTGKEEWEGEPLRKASEDNNLELIELPPQYTSTLRDLML